MRNIAVLAAALETVEERLCEPMDVDDLARACYLSPSGLQKLFAYAFGCPVKEYITKRRLSCAALELIESGRSITEIALDFQYGSPEAFSRAFKRFWGISPSEFRKSRRFAGLLPRFSFKNYEGVTIMSNRKPLDISELYEELKKLRSTYVLSVDLINFDRLNKEYGYAAGDLVIAEAFARMERELGEGMMLFRIGGDEFAVVTGYTSLEDAEALARGLAAHNSETISANGREVPVSLRVGISRLGGGAPNFRNALENMYKSIGKAREAKDNVAVYAEG